MSLFYARLKGAKGNTVYHEWVDGKCTCCPSLPEPNSTRRFARPFKLCGRATKRGTA